MAFMEFHLRLGETIDLYDAAFLDSSLALMFHGFLCWPTAPGRSTACGRIYEDRFATSLSTGIDLTRWVGSIGLVVAVGIVYFAAAA